LATLGYIFQQGKPWSLFLMQHYRAHWTHAQSAKRLQYELPQENFRYEVDRLTVHHQGLLQWLDQQ